MGTRISLRSGRFLIEAAFKCKWQLAIVNYATIGEQSRNGIFANAMAIDGM